MMLIIGKVEISRQSTEKSAFTLLELLLVIGLLAIIAGWSFPSFSRVYENFQVDRTTQELVSLMRYARYRAVIHRESLAFVWDSQERRFGLKTDEKLRGPAGRGVKIPSPIEIRADSDGMYFYPDGRMDQVEISVCGKSRCRRISNRENRGSLQISTQEVFQTH